MKNDLWLCSIKRSKSVSKLKIVVYEGKKISWNHMRNFANTQRLTYNQYVARCKASSKTKEKIWIALDNWLEVCLFFIYVISIWNHLSVCSHYSQNFTLSIQFMRLSYCQNFFRKYLTRSNPFVSSFRLFSDNI